MHDTDRRKKRFSCALLPIVFVLAAGALLPPHLFALVHAPVPLSAVIERADVVVRVTCSSKVTTAFAPFAVQVELIAQGEPLLGLGEIEDHITLTFPRASSLPWSPAHRLIEGQSYIVVMRRNETGSLELVGGTTSVFTIGASIDGIPLVHFSGVFLDSTSSASASGHNKPVSLTSFAEAVRDIALEAR